MTRATSGVNGHGYGWQCCATPGKSKTTRHGPEPPRALPDRPLRASTRRDEPRGQMHMQARIGMKLMRIIEGDRDRRTEAEDHG